METRNLVLRVTADGIIDRIITLPNATNARQRRFGFESIASVGAGDEETLYVAFQREGVDNPENRVRIGRYGGE